MSTAAIDKEPSARRAGDFGVSLITNHEAFIADFKNAWKLGSLDVKLSVGALLTEQIMLDLHRRMFDEVWKWAGSYRHTESHPRYDPPLRG